MSLPTNFTDAVLNTAQNTRRKYRMTQNQDGTVSFEDVTVYSTQGSNFGASQINATNGKVNELESKLEMTVSGTLNSGAESITLSSNKITANSIIDPYFWVETGSAIEPVSYATITVTTGQVVMTFDALDYDLQVGIIVR